MTTVFQSISDELVPAGVGQQPELLRQTNRVIAFHLAMLIWVPVFALIYCALSAPISSDIVLSGGALLLGNLMLLKRGNSPESCGNILSCIAWYVYTCLALLTGGAGAPVLVWYASIPVLSLLLSGTRTGVGWTLASVATLTAFAIARECGLQFPVEVAPAGMRFLQFSGLVGLVCCVFFLVCVLNKVEHAARVALHEANDRLEVQASVDSLTGIANRRTFDRMLEREWKLHARTRSPLSVALIDADFFKQYNDVRGHVAGDDCLRLIAEAIQSATRRPGDFASRYGGEEFAVILPNTDEAGARRVAETIRLRVKGLGVLHPNSSVCDHVTISIGLTTEIPNDSDSYMDLLKDADLALYRAKANGRNQCVQFSPLAIA